MQRAFALLVPFAGCAAMTVLCAWMMRRRPTTKKTTAP